MKMNFWAASAALFLFGGVAAQADTALPPSQNGYPFFVVPTCGSASFTSGKWVPGTIDVTGTLCTIAGAGGGGAGGGSVYGPDATGSAPTRAPIFTGGLDPSGFVRPFLTRADGTEATYQPDTRAVSQTLSSAVNSFIDIPVNGQSIVGLRFAGLTASGATITYLSSNDATQTPASPISSFNAATGTTSATRTTDGETRVPVSGRTTLRLAVTTGGTGSITVSYNASAVGNIVDIGSPVQIGNFPATQAVSWASAQPINNSQIGGVAISTGSGASGTGTQRVILATDNPTITVGGTVASTVADGASVALGAKADAAAGTGTVSAIALFKQLHLDLLAPTPAGTAVIGKVGIDQTTPGTTNGVQVTGPLGPNIGTGAAIGVVQQDRRLYSVSASSAGPMTGAGTDGATGSVPTAGYQSATVQFVTVGNSGNTYVIEESADNVNFIAVIQNVFSTAGNLPGNLNSVGNGATIPLILPFVRVRIATYAGGPSTAALVLNTGTSVFNNGQYVTNSLNLNNNVANIGSLGATTVNTGGLAAFSRIPSSAASTNLTAAKTSGGRVYKIYACNTTTTAKFIKFYNLASGSTTVGTSAVFFSRVLPASGTAGVPLCQSFDQADIGWYFSTAITYALTGANADSDTTALAAGDVTQVSVEYQ